MKLSDQGMGAAALLIMLAGTAGADGLPVKAQTIVELELPRILRAPAEVVPLQQPVIAAEITARVIKVHADVGDRVDADQVLLSLDPTDYQLSVTQIEAELAVQDARITQAQIRLERARTLAADSYVSADDLLARETDVVVLKAQRLSIDAKLATARHQLSKATIRSPFTATVSSRSAQEGALASAGQPMMMLTIADGAEVEAMVGADQADTLTAQASFLAPSGDYPVTLARITGSVDPATRNRTARLTFDGAMPPPGTAGRLAWRADSGLLPADVIVRRGGHYGVFVVRDDMAEFHQLETLEEGRAVAHDLPPLTLVITEGRHRVNDGDLVEVSR